MAKTVVVSGKLVKPFVATPKNIITKLAFMRRFSDAELAAIYTAETQSIQLKVWMEKFRLAEEINLDDQEIVGGVNSLEAMGILAPGRAAEVLA